MRAYFFTNMYLSSIQKGIQPAHTIAEMFTKYQTCDSELSDLTNWAQNHKTIIVLNGGYSSSLRELYSFLDVPNNPFAFSCFHESEEALDGAITCVGIVLPEQIYATAADITKGSFPDVRRRKDVFLATLEYMHPVLLETFYFTEFEAQMTLKLTEYHLA